MNRYRRRLALALVDCRYRRCKQATTSPRILFVDDEAGIRLTLPAILPAILAQNGFQVTTAATVSEAVQAINSQQFEALLSDLNIGEPGDGFTVVSVMRRTQPQCINFILTGYPAFESALQAIRNQVDEYLVKPANIQELVESLKKKLSSPRDIHRIQPQPLADFLREHAAEILGRVLSAMKAHPRLSSIPLTDPERIDHIPAIVAEIIAQLQSNRPDEPTGAVLQAGVKHGEGRVRQRYSPRLLVDDIRVLDAAIYDIIQDNLLRIQLSDLIPDLGRVNQSLEAHLQEALKAFGEEKVA